MSTPEYSSTSQQQSVAYPASARSAGTNPLAIVALVAAFIIPLAAIICGHVALGQIKRTGQGGHGLALTGTVLGYIFLVLGAIVFFFAVVVGAMAGASSGYTSY